MQKYVDLFAIYKRIRPALKLYLNKQDVAEKEEEHDRRSMAKWRQMMIDRVNRTPLVLDFLRQVEKVATFEQYMPITELLAITEFLGDSALKFKHYKEATNNFKTLVLLSEIYSKFKIILDKGQASSQAGTQRLIRLLNLNKKMMAVHNKMALSTMRDGNYFSCFQFLVCSIFVYNNSLRMIDQSDPLKYPKKNPNAFLDVVVDEAVLKAKSSFMGYFEHFNELYKECLASYHLLWKIVEHNPRQFPLEFFLGVKNLMENISSNVTFSKKAFHLFLTNSMPRIQTDSVGEGLLNSYQQNYIGTIESLDIDEFVDSKIQKILARGGDVERNELKPGKINKIKVETFFEFKSLNLETMEEVFSKNLYIAEKNYLEKLSTKENMTNLPAQITTMRSMSLGERTLPVCAEPSAVTVQQSVNGKIYSSTVPAPLVHRINVKEYFEEFLQRVASNMSQKQLQRISTVLNNLKKHHQASSLWSKKIKADKGLIPSKRKNKVKRQIVKSELITVDKIGLYLRKLGNVDTYRKPSRSSRFYKESAKEVMFTKQEFGVVDYRDRRLPDQEPYQKVRVAVQDPKSLSKSLRRVSGLGVPDRKVPGQLAYSKSWAKYSRLLPPTDYLNNLHLARDFYEDYRVRCLRMAKRLKKLNAAGDLLNNVFEEGEEKTNEKHSSYLLNQDQDADLPTDDHVRGIDNSIQELDSLVFTLPVTSGVLCQEVEARFEVSDTSVVFIFRFTQGSNKVSHAKFELKLPQQLWILKEKFLLGKSKDLIKTYNPVIFDLLLKDFFEDTLSAPAQTLSLNRSNLDLFEDLKRIMGLKYPISLTRLNSYDFDYLRRCSLFQEFTKLDLDSLQALLKVLRYLAQVLKVIFLNGPSGQYPLRYFDLAALQASSRDTLKLINNVFLLNYQTETIRKVSKQQVDRIFFLQNRFLQTNLHMFTEVNINNITSMLEGMFFQQSLLLSLSGPTRTRVRKSKDGHSFDVLVARQTFLDEYKCFNYMDLSIKVIAPRLKSSLANLGDYYSKMNKILNPTGMELNKMQVLLLMFFLILENSLVFYLRVDSPFRQKWLHLFKSGEGEINVYVDRRVKSQNRNRKLILEMPLPKIHKSSQTFISLSEFYFMLRGFQGGAKSFGELDPFPHSVVRDVRHNPFSLFKFLADLCAHPYSHPQFPYFSEKLLQATLAEPRSLLVKSRSFYFISFFKKEYVVKPVHFYYFQYKILQEYTRSLSVQMYEQLQQLQAVLHRSEKVSFAFFNTFFQFYRLATLTGSDNEGGQPLHPQEKLISTIEEGSVSIVSSRHVPDQRAPLKDFTAKGSLSGMFEKNFLEVMQNIPKNSNVEL